MLRTLRNSVAVIAASAALTAPVMAQTTAPAAPAAPVVTAPAAPATTAPATALPAALTDLGITDATLREGRKGGQRAEGVLPGGTAFQAMLDDKGALRMIRTTDEAAALPADLVARLVPEAVRANAVFGQVTTVKGVAQGDQGVMVFGTDAAGQPVRAGFAADGTLQRFGRGDMDHGDKKDGKKGDRKGKHGKGDRGERGEGRGEGRGDRDGDREDGPRGGPQGGPAAALDDAGVQALLTDAGYTQPGAITRNGPRTEVEAVNPAGQPVTVTINPRGVIIRELAR